MIKKLRQFFSPVQPPHQAQGLRFMPWYFKRYYYLLFYIIADIIVFTQKSYFYKISGEPFWYWFLISFFSLSACFIVFKSLQHWNDLKNGRSR